MHHRNRAKHLLVFHQGALGDFITTFPVLLGLRRYYANIAAICRPQFGELAEHLELIDEYFPVDAARFASLYTDRIDPEVEALLSRCDAILLFTFSTDLEASVSTVKARNVYRIPPRPRSQTNVNVAGYLIDRVAGSGLVGTRGKKSFSAAVSEERHQRFPGRSSGRPDKIIISPGAGSLHKCWPLERFLELAVQLKSKGAAPGFLLGPAERESPELADLQRSGDVCVYPAQTLPGLVTLFNASDAFIGNDSGIAHLAAFLGTATLVIFGPSNPVHWRPYGPRVHIVSPDIDCSPCFETLSDGCDHLKCLSGITVDRVINGFDRLFAA